MMQIQWVNLSAAFLEGFALILSPCILPVLPIVFAGGITGDKRRMWGILIGFVAVFALFTTTTRLLVSALHLDPMLLRTIGFVVLIVFGIILISDRLSEKFSQYTQGVSQIGAQVSSSHSTGLGGGLLLGGALSLIWTPCGGPILAAALVQSAVQNTYADSLLILAAFALGSVIPMLLIALLGKQLIQQVGFLKNHGRAIRKVMGVVIILAAIGAIIGPRVSLYKPMPDAPNVYMPPMPVHESLIAGLKQPYPAPPLREIQEWINSDPLTLASLKGKVVLIDFWTYSCINCVRTLPELINWYNRYHDKGLVIIGVHSPEFEFEKNPAHVKTAIAQYHIPYPVALDSRYGTWQSFHNHYWPAQYLIDQNGNVVYQKFGEGNAEITEHNILSLLSLPTYHITMNEKSTRSDYDVLQTPELYLGSSRAKEYEGSVAIEKGLLVEYAFPALLPKDAWSLSGAWTVEKDRILSGGNNAAIRLHFFAGKVYAVMGNDTGKPISVTLFYNGAPMPEQFSGKDVKNGRVLVSEHGLYELFSTKESDVGIMTLQVSEPGLAMYTFTFGA